MELGGTRDNDESCKWAMRYSMIIVVYAMTTDIATLTIGLCHHIWDITRSLLLCFMHKT